MMSLDTSSSLHAVLAFFMWTYLHILMILIYRSALINTGKALPSSFGKSRNDIEHNNFIGRVGTSHANCVENLILFAVVVIISHFLQQQGGVNNNDIDNAKYAWIYVTCRIGQSISHWISVSDLFVTIRFMFFAVQLLMLAIITYKTISSKT